MSDDKIRAIRSMAGSQRDAGSDSGFAEAGDDEIERTRERVFHRHEVFYRDDALVLLAEIDRLREERDEARATAEMRRKGEPSLWAEAASDAAEDMRRRAVDAARSGWWKGARLAEEIEALPLLADGETSESEAPALGEEREG